jgi:hypothetical protein
MHLAVIVDIGEPTTQIHRVPRIAAFRASSAFT